MNADADFDLDALAEMIDEDEDIASVSPASFSNTECTVVENEIKPKVRQIKSVSVDFLSSDQAELNGQKTSSNKCDVEFPSIVHSGEADSSDDENKSYLTESGKMIKNRLVTRPSYENKPQRQSIITWKDKKLNDDRKRNLSDKSYTVEEFSGLRIVNPLVSHELLKTRMLGRRMVKMSYIRNYMRNGDIEGDWVTIGVVVYKSPPKTSKNGKTFSIWKLTDLHIIEKQVSVFLFGAVHVEHWKTALGTVVGILNPSFLPNRDGAGSSDVSLSVDHAGKIMIIGTSKDFGHCKGRRKDGAACSFIINKSQCEYCTYHVSKEYKKMSSKRIELQASYSGARPNLKNKVLKGQNVMYGGQLFCSPSSSGASTTNSVKSKDKLRLNNLTLKRKAEEMEKTEREACNVKNLSAVHGIDTSKDIVSPSQFINEQLSIPSAGSKNLFRHLVKKEKAEIAVKQGIVSVTPKELLKMHEQQLKIKRQKIDEPLLITSQKSITSKSVSSPVIKKNTPPANSMPQIGRGFRPGDEICFDVLSISKRNVSSEELTKLKAINKIKEKGSIKRQDPNAVKSKKTAETRMKIQASLEKDIEADKTEVVPPKQGNIKSGVLGTIDLSSEKIAEILNRKSSHAFEIEMEELEKQELYFRALEKKEQMEEKMLSTTEMVCEVISCRICKYTAHKATDLCKNENHPLRSHKAVKRFFFCLNCKRRTCAFTKLPTRPCKNCGETNFERTTMMKPRSGPKLENETLKIRGDEIKFLNSFRS